MSWGRRRSNSTWELTDLIGGAQQGSNEELWRGRATRPQERWSYLVGIEHLERTVPDRRILVWSLLMTRRMDRTSCACPTYGLTSFSFLSSGYSGLALFCMVFGVAGLHQGCSIQCVLVHNRGFICKNTIFLLRQKRLSKIFIFSFFSKCWWAPSMVRWTQNSVFLQNRKLFCKAISQGWTFFVVENFLFFSKAILH